MKQFSFGQKIPARSRREARSLHQQRRSRRSVLERLEDRNLLTGMPFGALPDDTAEYMLGDVYVNVVLMESDSSMSPFDVSTENWTASEISDVKARITDGLKWWEETLDRMPSVRDGLLKFTIDWTHADTPVHTGYEPITRLSQEFPLWVYDFLGNVGFAQSGNFLTDLRAYNDAQRLAHNANWAFTIFVADDSYDLQFDFNDNPDDDIPDYDGRGRFATGSNPSRSFAYAGGNAFVMPADRPASIVAHETGHIFWALDEYNTSDAQLKRGYYNTQNSNSNGNPAISIMASGTKVDDAYAAHISSTPSLEMIGWKDSDGDGIFDVLDVPFALTGTGKYNSAASTFKFVGKSQVRTLANQNTSGLKSDITINQIDRAEYSIDGGAWTTAGTYHKYVTDLDLTIPVSPGASQLKIRTVDDRTGVMSVEYVANFGDGKPHTSPQPGISGYVYSDRDGSGTWESAENGLTGWLVRLVNQFGQPVNLHKQVEPDDYSHGALLNNVAAPAVTLSAVGGDVADGNVYARYSVSSNNSNRVFANNSVTDGQPIDTWTGGRQLRIAFTPHVTEVNITAISSGGPSVGRLEIYNSSGVLLARYTTAVLATGKSEVMKLVRPQGDISYAIASGHAGTKVVLDTLEWGATSSDITDQFGYYSLPELASGLYRVAVVAMPFYSQSFPFGGIHLIDMPDAMSGAPQLNFGFIPQFGPWRNPDNGLDVNDDGFVSAIDALVGINYINTHDATLPLPPERPDGDNYYDVNNDGYATAGDVLLVINELNKPPPSGGEGFSGGGSGGFGSGSGGGANGEADPLAQPLVPGDDLAAQYYSRSPLQVLDIPGGSDSCHCDQCTAITEVASGRVNNAASTATAPTAVLPLEAQSFAAAKKDAGRLNRLSEAPPHIDISLLNTLATAVTEGENTKAGRRGRR
ncbi:MAG: dockerin type I domain-containing protein [Pirellulaceae bacterium]